jgi:hypothetical protein
MTWLVVIAFVLVHAALALHWVHLRLIDMRIDVQSQRIDVLRQRLDAVSRRVDV